MSRERIVPEAIAPPPPKKNCVVYALFDGKKIPPVAAPPRNPFLCCETATARIGFPLKMCLVELNSHVMMSLELFLFLEFFGARVYCLTCAPSAAALRRPDTGPQSTVGAFLIGLHRPLKIQYPQQ